MINLHKICQIPKKFSVELTFSFSDGSTFANSCPSPVKSLCCTDKIESIEWQDLVPRQRTGDCFEIHLPHWGLCDQPLSGHQTLLLEVLLSPVRLLQGALVISVRKQTSQVRSFGKLVKIRCFLVATSVRRSESES